MKKATHIFRRGDILRLPFPYVEDNRSRNRPCLVVSDGVIKGRFDIVWVAMITGAGNEPWPDDVLVGPHHKDYGLPIPSRIRVAKLASMTTDYGEVVGHLSEDKMAEVLATIDRILGRATSAG